MRGSLFKTSLYTVVIIVGIAMANQWLFHDALRGAVLRVIGGPGSIVYEKLSWYRRITTLFIQRRGQAEHIAQLEDANHALASQLAKFQDVQSENTFLRKAMNIRDETGAAVLYARVFGLSTTSAGSIILLNRGSADNIPMDGSVVDENGVLIGKIQEVFSHSATVMTPSDPRFSITARVAGFDTAGLAKGTGDTMSFDLIVQNDTIKEGDQIISTGNDTFPAGLHVGVVEHIEAQDTQVFKKVRIRPAFKDINLGKVLIIPPR